MKIAEIFVRGNKVHHLGDKQLLRTLLGAQQLLFIGFY